MDTSTHGGKGSTQRPTNLTTFAANYDLIFGQSEKEKDREICDAMVQDLLGPSEEDMPDVYEGEIPKAPEHDYTCYCMGCKSILTDDELVIEEVQEAYDIGDRKVFETGEILRCMYCNDDHLEFIDQSWA